nr:putative protein TPRXL [Aegilops tauschii subsp. strangulata]
MVATRKCVASADGSSATTQRRSPAASRHPPHLNAAISSAAPSPRLLSVAPAAPKRGHLHHSSFAGPPLRLPPPHLGPAASITTPSSTPPLRRHRCNRRFLSTLALGLSIRDPSEHNQGASSASSPMAASRNASRMAQPASSPPQDTPDVGSGGAARRRSSSSSSPSSPSSFSTSPAQDSSPRGECVGCE